MSLLSITVAVSVKLSLKSKQLDWYKHITFLGDVMAYVGLPAFFYYWISAGLGHHHHISSTVPWMGSCRKTWCLLL